MTREEAVEMIKAIKNGLHKTGKDFPYRDEIIPIAKEALEMAIKALEQEPCEDCISRQAAIALVDDLNDGSFEWATVRTKMAKLPPVTPQPKMDNPMEDIPF